MTPLHAAAQMGHNTVIVWLVCWNPKHIASYCGFIIVCQIVQVQKKGLLRFAWLYAEICLRDLFALLALRFQFTYKVDNIDNIVTFHRWASLRSVWLTGTVMGPLPCTLQRVVATRRCSVGCCCTGERLSWTTGEAPHFTTLQKTGN